jgi:signal transduction histidine kinase
LRNRLIAFAAACLLPVLLVFGLFLAETADSGRELVLDAQSATAEVVASVLAATLADNHKMLQELASIDRLRRMVPGPAREALDQFSRPLTNVYGLFLVDANGNLVASTGIDPTQFQHHTAFNEAIERSIMLGEPGVSTALTAPDARVIALTDPVRPRDQAEGEPIGAVGALLSVERLGAAVLPFARGDTIIAVVADGQLVATQGADPAVSALAAETVPPPLATGPGSQVYVDQSGRERLAVYAPVPNTSWGVLVTHPSPTAYAPNRQMVNRTAMILAATALGTLVLAVLAGDLLARPLRELRSQAEALAAGDFTARDPVQGGGEEVSGLSGALGVMASRLGEQVRYLEEAREAGATQAEQMRELNRRTVRLQEDERRRIAGEIHDAVSPLITGALYQARALRLGETEVTDRDAMRRDSALDGINDLLSRAMEELHGVIFALRPPDLDDIGVAAAIERYIAEVQRSGLNVHLDMEGELPPLTPEVRLAIYRIVQEALHNALRHAAGDEAIVRIETNDDVFRVTIRDNGAGFDPEHSTRPTALGLLSMRERAAAIGATFAVMSRPGDGTTVMIERRIEPEASTVPRLSPVAELPELPPGAAKRIPA